MQDNGTNQIVFKKEPTEQVQDNRLGNLPEKVVELALKGHTLVYPHPKGKIIVMSEESMKWYIERAENEGAARTRLLDGPKYLDEIPSEITGTPRNYSKIYGHPKYCAYHDDKETIYFTVEEVAGMLKNSGDPKKWRKDGDNIGAWIIRNGHGFICVVDGKCVAKLKRMKNAHAKKA